MTDHCESCPWRGCPTCAYRGGVDPNAPVAQQDSGATRRANQGSSEYAEGSKTAPAGNRGLSPSEAAKHHGRTCIK